MNMERREAAIDEFAAPLGELLHTLNNALAAISTTAYALQIEQRLSDEDVDAILGGVDSARTAYAALEPLVRARGAERAIAAALIIDASTSVTALVGRPVTIRWATHPPMVSDMARATRRLIAALWTAAEDLQADTLVATCSVRGSIVDVAVATPDGRTWGPVEIAH
jgi:hypothetical protein